MKVERTKNGNIKIVMSEDAAWGFRDIIGRMTVPDILGLTSATRWYEAESVWDELDDLLQEGNK